MGGRTSRRDTNLTQKQTKRQADRRRDGRTNGGRYEGRKVKPHKKKKKRREEMRGEKAKRNHAWFTFNLSKGHGVPCGASARVRPLWAEQWVLIVLLVGVVGVVLGHGNRDGGGEELAPLPRILEAAERPRLLLIPYINKQDRHKEKNCREIWTQTGRVTVRGKEKEKKTMEAKQKMAILRETHIVITLAKIIISF